MEQISLMKISQTSKYILGILAAAGILAGCSGAQSGSNAMGANPSQVSPDSIRAMTSTARDGILRVEHGAPQHMWVSPDRKKKKSYLYISDSGYNVVWEYGLPSGKETGELTGFEEPQGECASGADWWVSNTEESAIDEYTAGGTTPIATVSDPGEYPVGCSYDKKTKDLAVTNIISTEDGEGSLAVYKNGSGTPTTYTCSNLYRYYFTGYDDKGDLFVDGENSDYGFGFCELPAGSSTLEDITLNVTPEFPGTVQWDGKYVDVGDQDENTLDQYTVSGTSGTEEGSVSLDDISDPVQCWIEKGKKVYCGGAGSAAWFEYAYPAGGSPVKEVSGLSEPIGATVAQKAK